MIMDVIVIGGGLAGLAATERLSRHGRAVTLLEARQRLGGRAHTVWHPGVAHPIELGAEWMAPSSPMTDVLARHQIPSYDAAGRFWLRANGQWRSFDAPEDAPGTLVKGMAARAGRDMSLTEALERGFAGEAGSDARQMLLSYAEGFNAADPRRVSLQWLAAVEASQAAAESSLRTRAGTSAIVEAIEQAWHTPVDVRLGTVVREIRWRPGHVDVRAEYDGQVMAVEATQAVITLPLSILQLTPVDRDAVTIVPEPSAIDAARLGLAMGDAIKAVLVFNDPFWHDTPAGADLLFVHAPDQPVPTWWTTSPVDMPVLTAWLGGPRATRWAAADRQTVTEAVLDSLSAIIGVPRHHIDNSLVDFYCHDWHGDPFARGAYSYVLAGGMDVPDQLAAPVDDTLYFAGEATMAGGDNATMDAAVASGWRAADLLLRAGAG
jgi:monoamine oxidase